MRLPDWIRTAAGPGTHETKKLLRAHRLATVCEEARCPNRGACFSKPTAAFMILGSTCTRNCGFCSVASAAPLPPDPREPEDVAAAAAGLGLRYVVITSVTRDDLPDGGAAHFAATVAALRRKLPAAGIELLVPDFLGSLEALCAVLEASPDVLNHNMETVQRLYPLVRPQAAYARSLELLRRAKEQAPHIRVKSGLMIGLGETMAEVHELLADLRENGCEYLTIGQYLQPTKMNLPVVKYIPPEAFEELGEYARSMGFASVASGPLVRSSMNAEEMHNHVRI